MQILPENSTAMVQSNCDRRMRFITMENNCVGNNVIVYIMCMKTVNISTAWELVYATFSRLFFEETTYCCRTQRQSVQ